MKFVWELSSDLDSLQKRWDFPLFSVIVLQWAGGTLSSYELLKATSCLEAFVNVDQSRAVSVEGDNSWGKLLNNFYAYGLNRVNSALSDSYPASGEFKTCDWVICFCTPILWKPGADLWSFLIKCLHVYACMSVSAINWGCVCKLRCVPDMTNQALDSNSFFEKNSTLILLI